MLADNSNVIRLARQARRWRAVAGFTTAIAAALVALIAVGAYQPDLLPDAVRPKPRIQVVEVRTPPTPAPPSGQFVAVLQRDGGSPAFILTVDAATRNFTVRRVGAAPEPGKSYELWIVSDKLQRPRSLGVIGGNEFTTRPVLSAYDPEVVNQATYAVTVEPPGGSPTGVATGPIVFTGKLVETVPPAAQAPAKDRCIKAPQKENARGERAFSVVNLGVVGVFYYPRGDFGGLVKSRVNSVNSCC